MSITLSLTYDPMMTQVASNLSNWQALSQADLQTAMGQALTLLQTNAQSSMHWKAPTGNLESSLVTVIDSPMQGRMGTNVVYAARRNYGFSGMSDKLGRYFANDPGSFYMESAITLSQSAIQAIFAQAAQATAQKVGFP